METVFTFLTVLSWAWSALWAITLVAGIAKGTADGEDLIRAVLFSLLAWCWLITRYCM